MITSTTMLTIENGVIKTPDIQFDGNCGGFEVLLFNLCQIYKNKIALVSCFIINLKLTITVFSRKINTRNDEFYTYNDEVYFLHWLV